MICYGWGCCRFDIKLAIRQLVEVLARFQEVKIAVLLGVQSFDVPTRGTLIVTSIAGASRSTFAGRPGSHPRHPRLSLL